MAKYANEHFECYIKEADLKAAILQLSPVPDNIDPVRKLDEFIKDILKEKRHQRELDMDNVLEKIQNRTRNVLGPLSRIWALVDEASSSKKHKVELSLSEIKTYLEQSVVLLGNSSSTVSYYRRYAMLLSITGSPQKAKEMLRNEGELLQKHDRNLFGKKFQSHISQVSKSKKEALDALAVKKKTSKPPFRSASPPKKSSYGGGDGFFFLFFLTSLLLSRH